MFVGCLFFCPMVMKTYRLDRIFILNNLKIFAITNEQLGLGITFFVAVEVVLLIVWTVVAPLVPTVVDLNDTENTQFESCLSDERGIIFFTIQLVYSGALMFAGCLFSVRIRNIKYGALNESYEIILAAYNTTLGIIVITPIAWNASGELLSDFVLIISIGTVVIMILAIGALFLLKFWRIFTKTEKIHSKSTKTDKTKSESEKKASGGSYGIE